MVLWMKSYHRIWRRFSSSRWFSDFPFFNLEGQKFNFGHVLTSKSSQWCRTKKKFPNVVSMLQHSRKVTKTRKVYEHRGYARAICYLLGWDPKTTAHDLFIRGCIPTPEEEQIDQEVWFSSMLLLFKYYESEQPKQVEWQYTGDPSSCGVYKAVNYTIIAGRPYFCVCTILRTGFAIYVGIRFHHYAARHIWQVGECGDIESCPRYIVHIF